MYCVTKRMEIAGAHPRCQLSIQIQKVIGIK